MADDADLVEAALDIAGCALHLAARHVGEMRDLIADGDPLAITIPDAEIEALIRHAHYTLAPECTDELEFSA